MYARSAPPALQPELLRWFALATALVWLGCGSASTTGRDEAAPSESGHETAGGSEASAADEDAGAIDPPVSREAEVDNPEVTAAPAVDQGSASAPPPATAEALPDPPCVAATQGEFAAACLESDCAPLRQRVAGYSFYSCGEEFTWEIWASHVAPEGITLAGPLMVHDVTRELASYTFVAHQRVEAIETRTVGDETLFFTVVSYVFSGEVPDSRGRQSLYELGADALVSVCRADGTCPIRNALAWRGSTEVNRPYRPSDAALARRGLEWRSAITIEGTRVTVRYRYRNVGYPLPDDVVSADARDPSTYVDTSSR